MYRNSTIKLGNGWDLIWRTPKQKNLQFAEDQVLIPQDKDDFEHMMRKIKEKFEKA